EVIRRLSSEACMACSSFCSAGCEHGRSAVLPSADANPATSKRQVSRTKVTSKVVRYSTTLPFSIAAFSLSTSRPVMLRKVLFARSKALRTASSQLCGDAPMIWVCRATAMGRLLSSRLIEDEDDLHVHPVLDDLAVGDLHPLIDHLEPG